METPVEIIGFEEVKSERGVIGVRLYGLRDIVSDQPHEGREAVRLYFNPEYVQFVPQIGQRIIAIGNRYLERIVIVG